MIAQSTCGGLSEKEGWIYAVRRPCKRDTSETCEEICRSKELAAQDPQIKAKTFAYKYIDNYHKFPSYFIVL